MRTRIRVAITIAALAAGTALFIGTPGAIATQGQPVLAGAQNTETTETLIANTNQVSLQACLNVNPFHDSGLVGCGSYGVAGLGTEFGVFGKGITGVRGSGSTSGVVGWGNTYGLYGLAFTASGTGVYGQSSKGTGVFGTNTGSTGIGVEGRTAGTGSAVYGHATANGAGVYGESETGTGTYGIGGPTGVYGNGTDTGVEGLAGGGGTGVYGHHSGLTGIGVYGQTGGTGSAVYGQATANGVGVYGKSQTGAALRGDSPSGTALEVNGKAKFSRSAIVTIASGTASKAVSLSGVSASSMVVATAQQNGSVFVKAAVPAGGSFTIFLNGNAPAGGLKVAYFVLN